MGMDSSGDWDVSITTSFTQSRKISCACADQYLIRFKGQRRSRIDQNTKNTASQASAHWVHIQSSLTAFNVVFVLSKKCKVCLNG